MAVAGVQAASEYGRFRAVGSAVEIDGSDWISVEPLDGRVECV